SCVPRRVSTRRPTPRTEARRHEWRRGTQECVRHKFASLMTPKRYAWILVAILWVVALLNYVDRQVIFSLFPLLSRDLSLSPVQLGLLSTVFLWVYGILSPFAGFAADRF